MNIAMILPSLSQTGPSIVAKDLCEGFKTKGHKCKVFYFDELANTMTFPCPVQKIGFKEEFDFDNWDVIHSHMFRPDAYVSAHKSKIKKSKIITTLHQPLNYKAFKDNYSKLKALILSFSWPFFLEKADNIVVLNKVVLGELPSSLKDKSRVIYNGRDLKNDTSPDLRDVEKLERLKSKYKIVGSISGINKRKGLSQLIRSLPLNPGIAAVLIGDGDEKENLENLAKDLKVQDRCLFMGFRQEPEGYLKYFDIFVMCSKSEGFPLALIEATGMGVPIVISDIPILKSIFPENVAVFYKLNDINDLNNKIRFALSHEPELSRVVSDYYQSNLTREIMVEEYLKLYCKD